VAYWRLVLLQQECLVRDEKAQPLVEAAEVAEVAEVVQDGPQE